MNANGRTVKVAISLPADLLASIDRARRRTGANRSSYLRTAAEAQLRLEDDDVDRYVAAYRAQPETPAEIAAASAAAAQVLAVEPFDLAPEE